MSLEMALEELRAHVLLQAGNSTLVFAVVPSDAAIVDGKRVLLELLHATPLKVADLGACTTSTGPARWAELTSARATSERAGVYVLSFAPLTTLETTTFAELLNAERQHMRKLAGPTLLVISTKTEQALRTHAHDFYTWAARAFAFPEPRVLMALAQRLGVATSTPIASAEPPIRFLHVSDFHLRSARVARYEQDRVLDGLVRFLERDRAEFPLDLMFVTGDLAFSGKAEEFAQVATVLRRLLDVTGVPPERTFVVPGNHDVERDVGRWLLRTLASDKQAIAFFEEPDGRMFHRKKLEAYEASLRELFGPERPLGLGVGAEAVELVEIAGTRLAVASFNSSWFAQGDDDDGNLWLGEPNVERALDRIADAEADFAISLVHHPFEYLQEIERDLVEHRFERGFDLVLRGHLHKDKTRSIATQRGGYLEVAAPAAYQGSQWPNGCFLGEIRSKARTVRLRPYAYAAGPDPWVLDTKVFPDDADDGYCRTFTIPPKLRRKSGVSAAARVSVGNAYVSASPYEKLQVQLQVLGEHAIIDEKRLEHEVVVRLAEESPELRTKILGNVDPGVALVSAIESQTAQVAPQISVSDAVSFERALFESGRLFLEHTAKRIPRPRMSESGAIAGLVASLGMVVEEPVAIEGRSTGASRADIVVTLKQGIAVIDIRHMRRGEVHYSRLLERFDRLSGSHDIRYAALVLLSSLPENATGPRIERVKTPAGRDAWVVHL